MKLLIKLIILTASLYSPIAICDSEFQIENNKDFTFKKFLLVESVIAVTSYLYAQNPKNFGGASAIIMPIVLAEADYDDSKTSDWVGIIGLEAFALYNFNVDENKISESKLIRNNFAILNLVFGTYGFSGYIMGDFDTEKSVTLKPTLNGGAHIAFNYKF